MKMYIATSIILVMIVFKSAITLAGAGACYIIDNSDSRSYCLAKERKSTSQCYAIADADMRNECLKEVSK